MGKRINYWQLLNEVVQNIVTCQWRVDRLICEINHDIFAPESFGKRGFICEWAKYYLQPNKVGLHCAWADHYLLTVIRRSREIINICRENSPLSSSNYSWKCHGKWTAAYNSRNAYNRKVNVIGIDVNRKRDSADLVFQEKISETLPKNCKNRQKSNKWMTSAAICENKHP